MFFFTDGGITPPFVGGKLLSVPNKMVEIDRVERLTTTIYKVNTNRCSFLVAECFELAIFRRGEELHWVSPAELSPPATLVMVHPKVEGKEEEDPELSWAKGFTYYNYTCPDSTESILKRMRKLHRQYGYSYQEKPLSNTVVIESPLQGARPGEYFRRTFSSKAAYIAGLFDNLGEGMVNFPVREEDLYSLRLLLQSIGVGCSIVSGDLWYSRSKVEVGTDIALFHLGQGIRKYSSRWVQVFNYYPAANSIFYSPATFLSVLKKGTETIELPVTKADNFIVEGFLVRSNVTFH